MKRIRTILPFLFVAAATGGFLACAFASSDIWLDEAATLALASRHLFAEIPGITAGDVHPPLYYWLLRIPLLLFPGSTAAAKAFSVLPCALVLLHGVRFLLRSKRIDAAFLFAFAFCASARIAEIATDVRMYSWASLFVFETGLCCWRVLQERRTRDFAVLGVLASLAAWTHYAAGLAAALAIAGTVVASFLLYPRKRLVGQFALTALAGTLLYSPWLVVLVRQVGRVNDGRFWVKTVPGLGTVRSCVFGLFEIGPETASAAMLVAASIVFVRIAFGFFPRSSSRTEQSTRAGIAVLAATPLATAAFLILYSRFVSPVSRFATFPPAFPFFCSRWRSPSRRRFRRF